MATAISGNENPNAGIKAVVEPTSTKQSDGPSIYDNFVTPLMGQFLNLPREPALIKCPACGIKDHSRVENDYKWWAQQINEIYGCLFIALCCCCCFNAYLKPCKQTDRNHYCKNCGCYFGRCMKHKQIKISKKK